MHAYIALHYIALHCMAWHCIALHILHYITLLHCMHYIRYLRYISYISHIYIYIYIIYINLQEIHKLHTTYTLQAYCTLHAPHHITSNWKYYITLRHVTLHYVTLRYINIYKLYCIALYRIAYIHTTYHTHTHQFSVHSAQTSQAVRWMFLLESGWPIFKIFSLAAWLHLGEAETLATPNIMIFCGHTRFFRYMWSDISTDSWVQKAISRPWSWVREIWMFSSLDSMLRLQDVSWECGISSAIREDRFARGDTCLVQISAAEGANKSKTWKDGRYSQQEQYHALIMPYKSYKHIIL